MISSSERNTACKGAIFNIQRFSLHDGPGIRTIVFFKGCPLRCLWCSNPESHCSQPQVMYDQRRCQKCGECIEACPQKALSVTSDGLIARDAGRCNNCGACVKACVNGALSIIGTYYSVEEILRVVEKDRTFYRASGGGVTLSGGEPLFQTDFALQLLKDCKNINMHTAVETSAHVHFRDLESISGYADVMLVDIKHLDPQEHKRLTGVTNELILSNISRLAAFHPMVKVRYPLIPGCNDQEAALEKLAKWLKVHLKKPAVELLPYHRYGEHKYSMLGRNYALAGLPEHSQEKIKASLDLLRSWGIDCESQDR